MRSRPFFPLIALTLSACSGFQRTPVEALPAQIPSEERYEVWSRGVGHRWHALRVGTDSLSGVPWWQATTCDSCRVTLARATVDSVRVEPATEEGDPKLLMAVLIPLAAVIYMLRGFFGG